MPRSAAEVACFAVSLYRRGRRLSVHLASGSTIKRGVVAGEWDCETGGTAFKRSRPIGHRVDSVEAARVTRVAESFARLLENLNVDLGECSCADDDLCPAHELLKALGGKR